MDFPMSSFSFLRLMLVVAVLSVTTTSVTHALEPVLFATGSNATGQFGDGDAHSRKTPVTIATDVAKVISGKEHTLFLKTDGTLWGSGNNAYRQLEDRAVSPLFEPQPSHRGFVKTYWASHDTICG
jgi:alpha-tubulin suppressor-like RCC1 family protein